MATAPVARSILHIGANGQLGWELRRALAPLGKIEAVGRGELDLSQADQIRARVREAGPSLIVNAAAYTAVERAEEEPDLAMSINGLAPGILAEEAKRLRIPIVHFSTDYVFDGGGTVANAPTVTRPYRETDPPNPLNVYGRTKLAGDRAIQAANPAHLIFRTGWVYSERGNNFLRSILDQARGKRELSVVGDRIGSPTWARMIAEATAHILARIWDPRTGGGVAENAGLYHISAAGHTSWHGFAEAILARARKLGGSKIVTERVLAVPSDRRSTLAQRPCFSVLDNSKILRTFGVSLPHWSVGMDLCLDTENMQGVGTH